MRGAVAKCVPDALGPGDALADALDEEGLSVTVEVECEPTRPNIPLSAAAVIVAAAPMAATIIVSCPLDGLRDPAFSVEPSGLARDPLKLVASGDFGVDSGCKDCSSFDRVEFATRSGICLLLRLDIGAPSLDRGRKAGWDPIRPGCGRRDSTLPMQLGTTVVSAHTGLYIAQAKLPSRSPRGTAPAKV